MTLSIEPATAAADEKHIEGWTTFNMEMRPWMTEELDVEAEEIGISRADLIRVIINEHLKKGHRA